MSFEYTIHQNYFQGKYDLKLDPSRETRIKIFFMKQRIDVVENAIERAHRYLSLLGI